MGEQSRRFVSPDKPIDKFIEDQKNKNTLSKTRRDVSLLTEFRGTQRQFSGKYLFGRRFEIYNFRNVCCKISCVHASPRIFEHIKNGVFAHF